MDSSAAWSLDRQVQSLQGRGARLAVARESAGKAFLEKDTGPRLVLRGEAPVQCQR